MAETIVRYATDQASPQELHEAFQASTVYCEAGERPGFLAVEADGSTLIPVYSSEEQLAAARGPVAWFSTTGFDLLGLVPEGCDLVVDPAGLHPLRLNMHALQRVTSVEIAQRNETDASRSRSDDPR